ncbi:MAG: pyridoxamine 5'-phosphate oxidase family protein [Alphaproteobacteria bacterium]|jgi:PPOX class probable FMN-dependent enzyme
MSTITTTSELEALYGAPVETSLVKEANRITSHYRTMIEASPFVALATSGPEGLDCSPRGDMAGFVRIHDETTVMIPDRRGNNRVDSLRNIVRDPKVALLFLLPGSGNTLRINGRAHLSIDPDLLASFAIDAHAPRSVIVIEVETIYFQCARAIIRAELWNPERHIAASDLPTPGEIISDMTDNRLGGKDYDMAWPEKAKATLW